MMTGLLMSLLVIQLSAAVMAVVVWLACRFLWLRRRPAIVHGLWMIVLVKMVTPALLAIPVLPRELAAQTAGDPGFASDRASRSGESAPADEPTGSDNAAAIVAVSSATPSDLGQPIRDSATVLPLLIVAVSLAGTLLLWIIAWRRATSIGRILQQAEQPAGEVIERNQTVAARFGLRTPLRVVALDADVSPLLWVDWRGTTIVFPERLLAGIREDQLFIVLAHETAHYVRRDHLWNLLAFLVTTLVWWNPLAWYAGRQARMAAEDDCDAMALERMNGSRQTYAQMLVEVTDQLSDSHISTPLVAASFRGTQPLRRRIEMIADPHVTPRRSWTGLLAVTAVAITIPLMPVRAQQADDLPATAGSDSVVVSGRSNDLNQTPAGPKDKKQSADVFVVDVDSAAEPASQNNGAEDNLLEGVEVPIDLIGDALKAKSLSLRVVTESERKFKLPDYLPAAHGNAVEISPNHFFMLFPLGNARHWHITYARDGASGEPGRTFWNEELAIPPLKDLKQGNTFEIHKGKEETVIAYVEDDYSNDLDIGIKIIDNATGKTRHSCTLLREMSRYEWVLEGLTETPDSTDSANGLNPLEK